MTQDASESQHPVPQGVLAVFTNERGDVIAHAANFDPHGGDAGFRIQEHQRRRARQELARAVAEAYCSVDYVRAMRTQDQEHVMQRLQDVHKCKVTFMNINYPPD